MLDNGRVISALDWHRWWFLLGPLFGIAWVLVIGALLRWTFSRRGSLAGASRRPASPDAYGHLRPLRRVATDAESMRVRARLQQAGIRSTIADTTEGRYVMVWTADLERARTLVEAD